MVIWKFLGAGSRSHGLTLDDPVRNLSDQKHEHDHLGEVGSHKIGALLKDARQRLVETGTRNRLIHVNRNNTRANVLNIINERADDVYGILKTHSRKMRFRPTGKGKPKNVDTDDTPLLIESFVEEEVDESRYIDNWLETPLGPDAQQKRLLRLARDARTAEEEQGINILYLAIGFLSWFEDKASAVKREAPVILMPVELVRNARTSTYDLICRDDEIVTNLPLQERLRSDFGIELPEIATDEENWSPSVYFEKIQEIVSQRTEWSIDRNGIQLGFFSFAKLLMLRDLDPENWPDDALADHPLLSKLLYRGFEAEAPLFGRDDKLDEKLSPADIIQVVDADASQTKVIEEVRVGRNLVVQGPPGTGKSQTITNLIASAVHDGKTVLFVAEKMAALSVVHNRLKSVGLESVCLELHSRAANKKKVISELARTLNQAGAPSNIPGSPDALTQSRDGLNDICEVLHLEIDNSHQSAFDVMAELVNLTGKGAPPPKLDGEFLSGLKKSKAKELEALIDTYCDLLGEERSRSSHPLYGVENLDLQPFEIQRLRTTFEALASDLGGFIQSAERASAVLNLFQPSINDIIAVSEFFEKVAGAPSKDQHLLQLLFADIERVQLIPVLEAGLARQKDIEALSSVFIETAYSVPIEHLRSPIAAASGSWFTKWGRAYRKASRELGSLLKTKLPKSVSERLDLFDRLFLAQQNKARFEQDADMLRGKLGVNWQAEQTRFELILSVAKWLDDIRIKYPGAEQSTIASLLGTSASMKTLSVSLRQQIDKASGDLRSIFEALKLNLFEVFGTANLHEIELQNLHSRTELIRDNCEARYGDWCQLARTTIAMQEMSLGEVGIRIDSGELERDSAKQEVRFARAEALWARARRQYPRLEEISLLQRHDLVDTFGKLEEQRIRDVRGLVHSRHCAQLPGGAIGEMGVILGEIGKKRAHKPVRKLIHTAGGMVQRIKPVLLMSPISVAQFLPPQAVRFDLLVIDEASQVKPEDALGAVARADQIVVVGDKNQLPPTTFFDRMTGNDDDDDDDEEEIVAAKVTEMESILTLCEARSVSRRMLEWHYRSRDPSLIRVSNVEFYENSLVLPPSPLEHDEEYGLKFTRVRGAYSSKSRGSGRPGTNKLEAQAIVDQIADHARSTPDLSLGVVTFSVAQRNMVTELLEFERRNDDVLDNFLHEGRSEDVFVKNIENVQGDERDVILVSVGYGPIEPGGRLASMSFGPINAEGGERRLNVLFSRARAKCEVFASFDPGDIDLSRTQKAGPRVLKRFLEFAKTGIIDQAIPTDRNADSPFEDDVAAEIRKLGYVVDHQVGSAGFFIDLGVKHPGRKGQYMLAVECDGATYHSALWARERDRLRQDVLEHLGWKFHRIWSTDWFYRRPQELDRLKTILQVATEDLEDGVHVQGANTNDRLPDLNFDSETSSENERQVIEIVQPPELSGEPYERAAFSVSSTVEPHEANIATLADITLRIVQTEGPVHQDEVARRVASVFGKEKAGRRIVEKTKEALHHSLNGPDEACLLKNGPFWFTGPQLENTPVRNRADASASLQKSDMLPPMEIEAAIKMVIAESGMASEADIVRATARLFGFERAGTGLKAVIQAEIVKLPDSALKKA